MHIRRGSGKDGPMRFVGEDRPGRLAEVLQATRGLSVGIEVSRSDEGRIMSIVFTEGVVGNEKMLTEMMSELGFDQSATDEH